MDFTPDPHLLRALGNQNLSWSSVLGELVDNSFDAGASSVQIESRNRKISIWDDGNGVQDIASLCRLGGHQAQSSTALGMYGIGLKDAWLFCGGAIEVETLHCGVWSRLSVDQQDLVANNWQGPDPLQESKPDESSFTRVVLPLRAGRNLPKPECFSNLAWMFTPALMSGRQIVLTKGGNKKKPLAAIRLPQLIESVRDEFEVRGKKVRIEIGIVADGHDMIQGPFWISYRHRNINRSSLGCMDYDGTRMGGVVELLEGWSLSKNKDDLTDNKSDLELAIYQRIELMLKKAGEMTRDVVSDQLKTELEGMLNDAARSAKRESRNQTKEKPGTIEPSETPTRRRSKAKQTTDNPGSVLGSVTQKRGFKVGFYSEDSEKLGEYDSLGTRVRLNRSHRFIESVFKSQNAQALYVAAVAILSDYCVSHRGEAKLLFAMNDFGTTSGKILNSVREVQP